MVKEKKFDSISLKKPTKFRLKEIVLRQRLKSYDELINLALDKWMDFNKALDED